MGLPIALSDFEVASSIGNGRFAFNEALKTSKRALEKNHRYKDWISHPAGEIDFSSFDSGNVLAPEDSHLYFRMIYECMQALAKRTKVFDRYAPERIGLFFGTSTSGIDQSMEIFYSWGKTFDASKVESLRRQHISHAPVRFLKRYFPIKGTSFCFSTACSSAAHAIAEAQWALQNDLMDACLVGGFDILNLVTLCGFDSLQILDSEALRPFCLSRKGTSLSEGGALFLLEKKTQSEPLAWVLGAGASSDAYLMTQPDPEGKGMELAMQRALSSSSLKAEDISYINAHGTGTEANDRVEALAIQRTFGSKAPVSSTKTLHGHALGASGAIEAAASVCSILENCAWAAQGNDLDRALGIHFAEGERLDASGIVLSNSFGFGGNNVSLIFGRGPRI